MLEIDLENKMIRGSCKVADIRRYGFLAACVVEE